MGLRDRIKNRMKQAIGKPGAPPQGSATAAGNRLRSALASLPQAPDAQGFHAVATSDLVPEGGGNTFRMGRQNVAVFRVGGKLYAIDDECRHENGPLGEGALEGQVVTCPYHDWRYDVTTGDCLTQPERPVACFSVKEQDGFVWVGAIVREGSEDRGGQHDDGLATAPVEGVKI